MREAKHKSLQINESIYRNLKAGQTVLGCEIPGRGNIGKGGAGSGGHGSPDAAPVVVRELYWKASL